MIDVKNQIDYARNCLWILTKNGTKERLIYNNHQLYICNLINDLRSKGIPPRIIILKARQLGISTLGSSIIYKECATEFYKKGVIIAHDSESTDNIFNMCKRYHDFSPDMIKPMKRYSNAKELVFENPDDKTRTQNTGLMSRIEVETAMKVTAGRSSTIHALHISELGFWKNASITCSGMLQAVPTTTNSLIIIESTANGMHGDGKEFYQRWQDAKQGKSDFIPVFFPWHETTEYEMDDSQFEPDAEEQEYMKTYPFLTTRKMAWRRYKINNDMGRSIVAPEDAMAQDFPTVPEEAFISSGRPVFNVQKIMKDIERAKNVPYRTGYFDGTNFIDDKKGTVKLFKKVSSVGCAMGADVAEGVATGDHSASTILDKNMEQLLSYHAHIDPDLFGEELAKMGNAYNKCVLAVEVNNHGHSTINTLKRINYSNLYRVEIKDEKTDKKTWRLGWLTTSKSKMLMIDALVAAHRDNEVTVNDVETLEEMATLIFEESGDIELTGKDRVVALCIAIQALKQVVGPPKKAYNPNAPVKSTATFTEKMKYHTRVLESGSQFE